MTELAVRTSLLVAVDPQKLFVPTGLLVSPGQHYRFTATGLWRDGGKTVDADGWICRPLQSFNRLPGAHFFVLRGCVGVDVANAFAIGKEKPAWSVPETVANLPDRQLHLFANDWRCMYFNNHALSADEGGPLKVTITRLAPPQQVP